jgi:hypothetical protein
MISNIKILCKTISNFRNLEILLYSDVKKVKYISDDDILECIEKTGYVIFIIPEKNSQKYKDYDGSKYEYLYCEFSCDGCHSFCYNYKFITYQSYIREYKLKRLLK